MLGIVNGKCVVCNQPIKYCPRHDEKALYKKIIRLKEDRTREADIYQSLGADCFKLYENNDTLIVALERIKAWNEHTPELLPNYGLVGIKCFYRSIAVKALKDVEENK